MKYPYVLDWLEHQLEIKSKLENYPYAQFNPIEPKSIEFKKQETIKHLELIKELEKAIEVLSAN
jgi:hypothetical protein